MKKRTNKYLKKKIYYEQVSMLTSSSLRIRCHTLLHLLHIEECRHWDRHILYSLILLFNIHVQPKHNILRNTQKLIKYWVPSLIKTSLFCKYTTKDIKITCWSI